MADMSVLIGKIPAAIFGGEGDGSLEMYFSDGSKAEWLHHQDCCELVDIEDVTGEWSDLIGHPLLVAEERSNDSYEGECRDDCDTWTFYTFRGVKGSVDVRWHGSSNGYYSTAVDFEYRGAENG